MPVRNRLLIGFLATLATAAVAVVALVDTALVWLDTCDGDGGYPYSAPDSAAGRFCDSSYSGPYFVAMFAVPVLCLLVLGVLAVWRRRLATVAIGVGAGLGLLAAMTVIVLSLPDSCGQEEAQRNPSGCETY